MEQLEHYSVNHQKITVSDTWDINGIYVKRFVSGEWETTIDMYVTKDMKLQDFWWTDHERNVSKLILDINKTRYNWRTTNNV